ncbi:MAG: sigma-70 family RNA polymerase sigma factor, partial [Bacteroidota bacterium]
DCSKNKRRAQNELFKLLAPYLAAVCRRYLINQALFEDAMQETFIRLFSNIKQYDESKGAFKTWAVRIAINVCLRTEEKERRHLSEGLEEEHAPFNEPRIYSQLEMEYITQRIKGMPRSYFEVFNMHVVDGLSFQEISKDLEVSQDLVRQRLSRARKWIKKHLESDEQVIQPTRIAK